MTLEPLSCGFIRSEAMKEAVRGLIQAIESSGGVTLQGEPGTGREMFARAIHAASDQGYDGSVEHLLRRSMRSPADGRPFVAIDCAEIPDLQKQLFGCPRPGAEEPKGLDRIATGSGLHRAFGGTLFIRQLPEMPGQLQTRLACVLRDKEVSVGSEEGIATERAELRPIAALEAPVGEDRVLPELRKRLSQTIIAMPSLRDRREDIPALVRYYLADISAALKLPTKTTSTQATELLAALPWRGNLDELSSLLRILVLKVQARIIRVADVLAYIRLDGGPTTFMFGGSLKQARERFECEYVTSVLEQHRGRMAEAAKALGIQRTNLYRKVRKLSVRRRRV